MICSSRSGCLAVSSVASAARMALATGAAPSLGVRLPRASRTAEGAASSFPESVDVGSGNISWTAVESPEWAAVSRASVAREANVSLEMPPVADAAMEPELSMRMRRATFSPELRVPRMGRSKGQNQQRDEEAAQQQNEPFVDFALGAQARIDAQEKHERGKLAHLPPQPEEEMEDDGQHDGGQQPHRDGVEGEEEAACTPISVGGPDNLLSVPARDRRSPVDVHHRRLPVRSKCDGYRARRRAQALGIERPLLC